MLAYYHRNYARERQQMRRFGPNSGRVGSNRLHNTRTRGYRSYRYPYGHGYRNYGRADRDRVRWARRNRGPVSEKLEILFCCCADSPLCFMLTNLNCQSTFVSGINRFGETRCNCFQLSRLAASPSALSLHLVLDRVVIVERNV
jgi:hypothetical protein